MNSDGDSIGRITLDGTISEFETPDTQHPISITSGPDGALWFTGGLPREYSFQSYIGRITRDGAVGRLAVGTR